MEEEVVVEEDEDEEDEEECVSAALTDDVLEDTRGSILFNTSRTGFFS